MNDKMALDMVNKIFQNVFEETNNFSLDILLEKFAFDVKLPKQVTDSTTNEVTWADSVNSGRYITLANMEAKDMVDGWMIPKKEINNLKELIDIWNEINLMTTERVYDSINVLKSDTIYNCENVYRSTDCTHAKNIIYCDSVNRSEYLLASQRSTTCTFCIRTDDSKNCSNSYNVLCSNKIINSYFIQDCFDLYECMFCSHIANKKFCIANMQFEEAEYFEIKKTIVDWILNS
ncbi:MAG: hypothetical protein IJO33_03515 [Bacilli bacterium]|nr:hypothetical protein [Bacilli bacterium]